MRSIEHPGPVHPTRIECVPANVRAVEVELPPGVTLLQGLANAVQAQGATSAVFSFRDGSFAPLRFVMPALADSPTHVAYFSERFEAAGAARIESGSVTFGSRDGEPTLHCHATWTESDGRRRSGHVLAAESQVEHPTRRRLDLLQRTLEGCEVVPLDDLVPLRREPVELPRHASAEDAPQERRAHDDLRDQAREALAERHVTAIRSSSPGRTPVRRAALPRLIATVTRPYESS